MTWGEDLAAWWVEEVATDPAYEEIVLPLVADLIGNHPAGQRWLDLGCGEGRVMRQLARLGSVPVGCDSSATLARLARETGPVVRGSLPDLDWLGSGSVDGAVAVLVLEHLEDVNRFFGETARVIRDGGSLVVVGNHPAYTAPGSAPVVDVNDGEVLWRWGPYLEAGSSEEPAGRRSLTFHHRPLGVLLSVAADAGWSLQRLVELGLGVTEADSPLFGQAHIPRLLGAHWTK